MAIETINLGNLINDGLGDDLRTAFLKVNNNFNFLNLELGITGANIGAAGVGIFKDKIDGKLLLKNIAPGDSTIVVIDDNDTVKISSPLQNIFSNIGTPEGPVSASSPSTTVNFVEGDNVRITKSGNNITFNADIVSTSLTGDLNLNLNNILGEGNIDIDGTITANNFIGSVRGIDIRPIRNAVFDFDFGKIILGRYSNVTEFLLTIGDFDFGSIDSPNLLELDLGSI